MQRRRIVRLAALLVVVTVVAGGAWSVGAGPFPERIDRETAEQARSAWRDLIADLDDDVPARACLVAFAEEADPPVRRFASSVFGPVAAVRGQVEDLRGWDFERHVEVDLVEPDVFDDRTAGELGTTDDQRAQLLLRAMDAIPRDGVLTELTDEQRGFAGIYFFAGRGLVAAADPDEPEARDRATIAHELGHALVDQRIGLPRTDLWPYSQDADLRDAALTVVEGDAALVQLRYWLHHVPIEQQLAAPQALDPYAVDPDSPVFHLDQHLRLPYRIGLDRACDAWLAGGMEAVDALHDDLPETMHEAIFGAGPPTIEPPDPQVPDDLDPLGDEPFGVGPLLTALQAPGNDPNEGFDDAFERAQAWTGGTGWVWTDEDDPDAGTVAIVLTDGGTGSAPLCDTIRAWRTRAAPDASESTDELGLVRRTADRTELVRCDHDVVWFVAGPDRDTLAAIVEVG